MYFIGNFVYANNQEEKDEADRRHGEFSLIIDAPDPHSAVQKFRDRIVRYRETRDFFQGSCSVYLIQLFEFEGFPVKEAMMLNYKSVAGDPLMPFIRCTLPNDLTDSCHIFNWEKNVPEVDGQEEKLFLRFEAGSPYLRHEPDPSFQLTLETR